MPDLIKWGAITAAGDVTTTALVEDVSSQTQAAILALIEQNATALGLVTEEALDEDPRLVRRADGVLWAASDIRRRDLLGVKESGMAFAPVGVETPFSGETVPDGSGVLAGTFDPIRRRYYQDAIGADGRLLQSTVDDIAARITGESGGGSVGVRRAPLALTLPASSAVTDTAAARTVRYPVKAPADVTRFRVHIANRNDRTGALYAGALSVTGLWWGEAAYVGGELTGATIAAPERIQAAFTTPATGAEWVSDWIGQDMPAGVDHILSLGYTTAGQTNHAGIGGAWVSTDPADASATAPTVTRVQEAPLDVWVECEIAADVPVVAMLGDSLTAGSESTLPVRDSWPAVFANLNRVWAVHYAHHGSTMAGWDSGDTYRWTKYGSVRLDAVIWALGSNDIFGGTSLADTKARFEALHPKVVSYLSPRVILATILPRNAGSSDAETVRTAYNAWLWQRPMGAVATVDLARSVEAAAGSVRADFAAADGVHLTTAGYAANALAIPGRVAV